MQWEDVTAVSGIMEGNFKWSSQGESQKMAFELRVEKGKGGRCQAEGTVSGRDLGHECALCVLGTLS